MEKTLPTFIAAIAAGTFGFGTQAQAEPVAQPFLLPIKCAPGFIPVSLEKGCIKDRTEEIARAAVRWNDNGRLSTSQHSYGAAAMSSISGSATVATQTSR